MILAQGSLKDALIKVLRDASHSTVGLVEWKAQANNS
jgi:hypothetical protein